MLVKIQHIKIIKTWGEKKLTFSIIADSFLIDTWNFKIQSFLKINLNHKLVHLSVFKQTF